MTWSLNEIESLSRKAARGAGLSWGLAEEAGKAARWLSAAALPGPRVLADLLTRNDGRDYETLCPHDEEEGTWVARGGTLCPLISGATLCDQADQLAQGRAIRLGRTASPMLLLPYLDAAAQITGCEITISWDGLTVACGPEAACLGPACNGPLDTDITESVTIRPESLTDGMPLPRALRGDMPPETAQRLAAFAQRTYAPETEESRLSGAGAGLTDND